MVDKLRTEGNEFETLKTELQAWYNQDGGISLQQELLHGLRQV